MIHGRRSGEVNPHVLLPYTDIEMKKIKRVRE